RLAARATRAGAVADDPPSHPSPVLLARHAGALPRPLRPPGDTPRIDADVPERVRHARGAQAVWRRAAADRRRRRRASRPASARDPDALLGRPGDILLVCAR